MTSPMMPQAPLTPPTPPWTPFQELPMDAEPPIAALRKRRLAHLMASTDFAKFSPLWQQTVIDAYWRMVQAVQAAQQAEAQATAGRPSPAKEGGEGAPNSGGSGGLVAG
jgi:hypothetical protein